VTPAAAALVGREHELAQLERALDALPEGSFLDLSGEAGIGKTRLLDELRGRADAREMLVLEGRGSEFEVDVPFGILVDALDEYLAAMDPAQIDRALGDAAADLGAVFPSLGQRADAGGRFRAHRAVAALLERLPPGRGLLLVLDDVHWADEASVEVLAHVLREPPPRGLVLALAYRARQSRGRLAGALDAAARRGHVERIELGPLAEDDAVALLPAGIDSGRARELFEASGGNPFYIEQLARAGAAAFARAAGQHAQLALPATVVAALSLELDGLPRPARTLLEAGAVVGEPFELDLAVAVAQQDEEAAFEALDLLLARDVLRPTTVPRRLRFRHPILRRVAYEASGLGWRLGAHARAAAALEARGAPAAVLARHVEQAAAPGDERAVALLTEAGDAAELRAPAAAAHWYAAALRLLHERGSGLRVELLAHWAGSSAVTGRMEEGRAAMAEALAALPEGEIEARTRITAFCSATEHFLGRHEQAHARLVAALPWIPRDASPGAAAIAVELAADAFLQGDAELLRAWASRGVELAEAAAEPLLAAAATAQLAFAALHGGDPAESRRLRAEACKRMDALADESVVARVSIAYYVGMMEHLLERDGDAERHLERALGAAHETGKTFILAPAGAALAQAKLRRGRVSGSADAASDAVDAARLTANRQSLAQALAAYSRALLAAGDVRSALAAAKESVGVAGELEPSALSTVSGLALAAALLASGRAADAAAAVRATAGLPLVPGTTGCEAHEMLASAALEVGRRDEAAKWAERASATAARVELPVAVAQAGRARALVALDAGAAAPAADAALAAAASAEGAGAVLEAAHARLIAGTAIAAAGDRAGAVAALRAAQAASEAAGARRLRAACDKELRRLGERVHRRAVQGAGEGVEALSSREREVALLVRDRKTNREIAAELFLSEKTVESHLRSVFGKLGLASRRDVAAALERLPN